MNWVKRGLVTISRVFLLLTLVNPAVYAADYSGLVSEKFLRIQFTFQDGDTLKYSECKKKSYPTCTYVWGVTQAKDKTRLKYGLAPDGNKLQIVYAQAKSQKDFQRVLSQYKDAEKVDAVGAEAAWSAKRRQLSFITESKLIVHINIDEKGGNNLKEKAIGVAEKILEQL